eukprot:TRINITY_DN955_c0_g1_i1.p1 TRINITY_DN955_c0_g1~~TRINITY_DN955_c0_g1_i1.p1  ORF type:complete len:285 (+),score=78.48 TRINITY_DN955_c0_g1_i1:1-855(+)
MERGSVRDVLDRKGKNIPWDLRVQMAVDAAQGMNYLHSRKVIHRDLKPQNFLVNDKWTCKIADFGISTIKPDNTQTLTVIGTPVYMAPEVLAHSRYTEKADVFSFGVCLIELFSGHRPYSEPKYRRTNQTQLMFRVVKEQLRPSTDGLPSPLVLLANDCWNSDPTLRPTFSEVCTRLKRLYGVEHDYDAFEAAAAAAGARESDTGMSTSSAMSVGDGGDTVEESGSDGSPLGWVPGEEATPSQPSYMSSEHIMGQYGWQYDSVGSGPSGDEDISLKEFSGIGSG